MTLCAPFIKDAAGAIFKFQTMNDLDLFQMAVNPPSSSTSLQPPCCAGPSSPGWGSPTVQGTTVDLGDHVAEALEHWIEERLLVRAAMASYAGDASCQPGGGGTAQEVLTPLRPYSQSGFECAVMTADEAAVTPARRLVSSAAPQEPEDDRFFDFPGEDLGMLPEAICGPVRTHAVERRACGPKEQAVGIATVFLCIMFRSRVPHSTRIAELAWSNEEDQMKPQKGSHNVVVEKAMRTILQVASISDVGKFTEIPLLRQDLADHFDFPAAISPNEALRGGCTTSAAGLTPNLRSPMLYPTSNSNGSEKKHSNSSIDELFLQSFTVRNTSIVVEMLQTPRNLSIFMQSTAAGVSLTADSAGAVPPAAASRALMSPDLMEEIGSRRSYSQPLQLHCLGDEVNHHHSTNTNNSSSCGSALDPFQSSSAAPSARLTLVGTLQGSPAGARDQELSASTSPLPLRMEPRTSRMPVAADRYLGTIMSAELDHEEHSVPRSIASTQAGAVGDDQQLSPLGVVRRLGRARRNDVGDGYSDAEDESEVRNSSGGAKRAVEGPNDKARGKRPIQNDTCGCCSVM